MKSRRNTFLALVYGLAISLSACGGGGGARNTGGSNGNNGTSSTINSVSVSCSPSSIQDGQTSQCTATVGGTGTFDSSVTWSADNGTIDQAGNYSAPSSPATATVKATSKEDGGKSGTASITIVAPQGVSISVTPLYVVVKTAATQQFAATVSGTQDINAVWSVNGVEGGNAALGTIGSDGIYTAPSAVPMPFTVKVTASSVADPTKTASADTVISGLLQSTNQFITAASGGMITLADGSSVTIPPNVLTADQNVTLSELSALPQQPPNQLITSVGPSLQVTLSTPISASHIRRNLNKTQPVAHDSTSSTDITFSVNEQSTTSGLDGSVGIVAVTDTTGDPTFISSSLSSGLTNGSASFSLNGTSLSSFQNGVQSLAASVVNTTVAIDPSLQEFLALPKQKCWDESNPSGPQWSDFSNCSSRISRKKVLVVVHGMSSCVEGMFPTPAIKNLQSDLGSDNSYDLVVGLDYDWTKSLTDNAMSVASLINILIQKQASVDILAHSEGVPVALLGAEQATDPSKIRNFIGLAGPITGTPAAQNPTWWFDSLIHFKYSFSTCPGAPQLNAESYEQNPPFQIDLQPNSSALGSIGAAASQLSNTRIILAGGENPTTDVILNLNVIDAPSPFGSKPNDGIVGLDSALGYGSGLQVYPLPPFPQLFHTDLPQNGTVIDDVANQIIANPPDNTSPHPLLTCQNNDSSCEGDQNDSFMFKGSGFGSAAKSAQIYSQDATGTVSLIQTQPLSSSAFSWTMPSLFHAPGAYSIFAFDGTLASNNIVQTICAQDCGTTNPVPAITALSPASLPVNSSPQVLDITGTGFLAASTITLGGNSHTVTFLSNTQLTIQLTQSDLTAAGTFTVIVTNPPPGGGQSNSLDFTVSAAVGGVSLSPTSVNVPQAGIQTFSANVSEGSVNWSVEEGADGGTITSAGIYTAPNAAGTFHVVATSTADASQSATATITVVPGPTVTSIHSFDHTTEGANPWAALIQARDGNFYGTTASGGDLNCSEAQSSPGCGTLFKMDPEGNTTVLHAFSGSPDGIDPVAPLLQASDQNFYGITTFGGANLSACDFGGTSTLSGCGTIFKLDSANNVTILHSFSSFTAPDGVGPEAGLIQGSDGKLYGSAIEGADASCTGMLGSIMTQGCGDIFSLDPSGSLTPLNAFTEDNGAHPSAALIQGSDGNFYGVTGGGGSTTCTSFASLGCGTIFEMSANGAITVLHIFTGQDGAFPNGSLIQAKDGNLYGTTVFGGSSTCTGGAQWQGCGVIFKIDSAMNMKVLHSFSGIDGAYPNAALIQASDGNFYGSTQGGGDSGCTGRYGPGCGTIFKMDASGNVTVLYSFTGNTDGSWPESSLVQASDGNLYGTAVFGGTMDDGVVFQISDLESLVPGALLRATSQTKQVRAKATAISPYRPHQGPTIPTSSINQESRTQ